MPIFESMKERKNLILQLKNGIYGDIKKEFINWIEKQVWRVKENGNKVKFRKEKSYFAPFNRFILKLGIFSETFVMCALPQLWCIFIRQEINNIWMNKICILAILLTFTANAVTLHQVWFSLDTASLCKDPSLWARRPWRKIWMVFKYLGHFLPFWKVRKQHS